MRAYSFILLSSLLLTGLAVNSQGIEYHSSEKLHKSDSVQQQVFALRLNKQIVRRGSGRRSRDIA